LFCQKRHYTFTKKNAIRILYILTLKFFFQKFNFSFSFLVEARENSLSFSFSPSFFVQQTLVWFGFEKLWKLFQELQKFCLLFFFAWGKHTQKTFILSQKKLLICFQGQLFFVLTFLKQNKAVSLLVKKGKLAFFSFFNGKKTYALNWYLKLNFWKKKFLQHGVLFF